MVEVFKRFPPAPPGRPPHVRRREAEAALRRLRRRYWTIRRVGFAIAYHGVLAWLIVAPWLIVGVVLWRSGVRKSLALPWPPPSAVTSARPGPPPAAAVSGAELTLTITEAQARQWLNGVGNSFPQLPRAEIDFRPGVVAVWGTLAGPTPQAFQLVLVPRLRTGRVSVAVQQASIGTLPATAAGELARSLVELVLARELAALHQRYAVSAVDIDDHAIRIRGRPLEAAK